MLLGAIVLIVAFIALAGMVSEVARLSEQVTLDASPIVHESEMVDDGVEEVLDIVELRLGHAQGTPDFETQVGLALDQLVQRERTRGYIYTWEFECDDSEAPAIGNILSQLMDEATLLQIRSTTFTMVSC